MTKQTSIHPADSPRAVRSADPAPGESPQFAPPVTAITEPPVKDDDTQTVVTQEPGDIERVTVDAVPLSTALSVFFDASADLEKAERRLARALKRAAHYRKLWYTRPSKSPPSPSEWAEAQDRITGLTAGMDELRGLFAKHGLRGALHTLLQGVLERNAAMAAELETFRAEKAALQEHNAALTALVMSVKVDELSPMDAMTRLYELQRQVADVPARKADGITGTEAPTVPDSES